MITTKFKKGNIPWNKGKYHSEETKKKMRENHADFSGENHPRWKGGLTKSNGRYFVWCPNGYIKRSHLIAEKCLSRSLNPQEVIHHINGDTLDDRPENLYLFSSQSIHRKYEVLKNKPILESNLL